MPADSKSRVLHLGALLENKNRSIRSEASQAFSNFAISDENTRQTLAKHLVSSLWEARVATSEAIGAILRALPVLETQGKTEGKDCFESESYVELAALRLDTLISCYKPLLSARSNQIDDSSRTVLNSRQQRKLIDQHLELDLAPSTGLSSNLFLEDAEVLPSTASDSPKQYDQGDELKSEVSVKTEADGDTNCEGSFEDMETHAIVDFFKQQIASLADVRWQHRHGAALSVSRILSCSWNRLTPQLQDAGALRLLQVLALDRFNDFVSGRSATAPVRESAAQALAHYIFRTDNNRKCIVMQHLRQLLGMHDEKYWVCRQSALLVIKYFFSIAQYSPTFHEFFDLVVDRLNDDVDDVVSSAVTALSSLFANEGLTNERRQYIDRVMEAVWELLGIESKKEQLRSGLDALAVDLLSIVDTWLTVDQEAKVNRNRLFTVSELIDAAFPSRTRKCIKIMAIGLERGGLQLDGKEVFSILKSFYRVIIFAPPTDSTIMFEEIYLVSLRIIELYRSELFSNSLLPDSIGLWTGCLLFDHKNPIINVFSHCIEGPSSVEDVSERMCSEEMRFLSDREKDDVYVTRKILAAKFLAQILQILYESSKEIEGQLMSTAIQLVLSPFIRSNSLYQNLGGAIVVHEWSQLYKNAVSRGHSLEAPILLMGVIDAIIRAGIKPFDELTSSVLQLTADCNEFIDYCCVRGANRSLLNMSDSVSVEDVARSAFDMCISSVHCEKPKERESLESRYKVLCDWIQFTKVAIRSNSNRVFAFLSSSLLNFGCVGEKMTPLVRPLVEAMQTEDNATVATEIFKGSVPLMIIYSWQRNPRPYVKVIAKTLELFSSCEKRIPRIDPPSPSILSLTLTGEPSAPSRNAELFLLVCCSFSPEQLPEFYEHFDLDSAISDEVFLTRLALHDAMWTRVGSRLSDKATSRLFCMLTSQQDTLRYAAAKSLTTFARSCLADMMNRCYEKLHSMIMDLDCPFGRKGAIETLLCLSRLGTSLVGVVSLLAPIVFPRLADKIDEVRDAAAETFRNMVPLLTLEQYPASVPPGLSDSLSSLCQSNSSFIYVLSQPSLLPSVEQKDIHGLKEDVNLRHYQLEGITWMRFLRQFGLNGILADDMGLGKTLQTLVVLAMGMQSESRPRPSLIVCPRTIVDHWCGEWKKWFPNRKHALKAEAAHLTHLQNASLVVTAYEDLKSNRLLGKVTWNYVILDEGHVLRNPKSAIWRAANELVSQSRLILSGTPVQNSPADLWALFTWLMPGYLGDEKQFRSQFLKAIQKCRSPKATEKDMNDGSDALSRLHKLVLPFVLRRMKNDVLPELPDKVVQDYECELTSSQRILYNAITDRCTNNQQQLKSGIGLSPLHALISLRKLVDHPSLVADILPKLELDASVLNTVRNGDSGKMAALGELLEQCGIGCVQDIMEDGEGEDALSTTVVPSTLPHRALIFCQWRSSVLLVSDALSKGMNGGVPVSHLILDGSIPASQRQSVVDQFNSDHSVDVLVLTTHIGGVGLNLIGADVVIFLDHDWNPMKDLQAIDRAHRLGQTRKVLVYRLITKGTIEEKVMGLQKFKQNTAQALIGTDNRSIQSMATDELMGLFTFDGGDSGDKGEGAEKKREQPAKKKPRIETTLAGGEDPRWNLCELWDESQYEETSNVYAFAREAKQ